MLVFWVVYFTDGTKNVFAHLFYLPIILSAYYFGIKGSVIVSIISGILIGPLMPLSISDGIMQSYSNWIVRTFIFTAVGLMTGYIFRIGDKLYKEVIEREFINLYTGAYNTNKLFINLEDRMKTSDDFAIVSIKLTNIETIAKYLDYSFFKTIVTNLIKDLINEYGRDAVYSSSDNEIILIVCSNCGYLEICKQLFNKYSTAIKIEQFTFRVSLKIGVYEYHNNDETPMEAFNKARVAYEQGTEHESGIYYYRKELEVQRKNLLEISGALIDSIKNNELYLVYQPKIDIFNNTISGVEVLTRWNRGGKQHIGPDIFIKIAEDIGFITEISKFVFDSASNQMIEWLDKGIKLNFALNFTALEILDDEFSEWTKRLFEDKGIERSMFEIEITERVLYDDDDGFITKINELIEKGYNVSIDDFGTGVNSLVRMIEIPYDQLKIDKYFIDRINHGNIRMLVKAIIDNVHIMNKKVVAEGVETEEQLKVLRELQCDIIQGYYYSKPLLPNDFEKYYYEFYNQKNNNSLEKNLSISVGRLH